MNMTERAAMVKARFLLEPSMLLATRASNHDHDHDHEHEHDS